MNPYASTVPPNHYQAPLPTVGWVGLGKLGLPCALVQARAGHKVIGTDVNPAYNMAAPLQCLAFSPTGVLYAARSALYTVDLVTGMETLVAGSGGYSDLRGIEFTGSASAGRARAVTKL